MNRPTKLAPVAAGILLTVCQPLLAIESPEGMAANAPSPERQRLPVGAWMLALVDRHAPTRERERSSFFGIGYEARQQQAVGDDPSGSGGSDGGSGGTGGDSGSGGGNDAGGAARTDNHY